MTLNERVYFVYILASAQNGTLYTGMTNDLSRRLGEHRSKAVPGFTRTYDVMRLVWYEVHDTLDGAFWREKCIKGWKRAWKVRLIERENAGWRDLTDTLV